MPPAGSCCERGICLMKHCIYDPGEEFGFVYTSGNNIPGSNCNFIALNVPRSKSSELGCCIMTNLAHFAVRPGIDHSHDATSQNLYLKLKKVDGERKQQLAQTHTTRTEPSTTLYELIPMFPYDTPEQWGSRPAFPDPLKESRVDQIIEKWRQRRGEFLLTNEQLRGPDNPWGAKPIDLSEALLHEDWTVDWTTTLDQTEIDLVREHKEWFSDLASYFFSRTKGCEHCKTLWESDIELSRCARCRTMYYCSRECQRAHWKSHHKRWCKKLASRRNSDDPRRIQLGRGLFDDHMREV